MTNKSGGSGAEGAGETLGSTVIVSVGASVGDALLAEPPPHPQHMSLEEKSGSSYKLPQL